MYYITINGPELDGETEVHTALYTPRNVLLIINFGSCVYIQVYV